MKDKVFDKLYQGIKHGNLKAVEEYLNSGGDPSYTTSNGWSLLITAAFKGNSRILSLLLERGAALETVDVAGASALSMATHQGHAKCVRLLLAHGASVSSLNWTLANYKRSALQHAEFFTKHPAEELAKRLEIAQLLADAGAA